VEIVTESAVRELIEWRGGLSAIPDFVCGDEYWEAGSLPETGVLFVIAE
jgi:hypothetical protein